MINFYNKNKNNPLFLNNILQIILIIIIIILIRNNPIGLSIIINYLTNNSVDFLVKTSDLFFN
jgi:hypothetical protein